MAGFQRKLIHKAISLIIAILLFASYSCNKLEYRNEKFSGNVVTKHGYPVPNAGLRFGYSIGGKNAIQAYTGAITDANGHFEVNQKISRKAYIQVFSVSSDSGRINSGDAHGYSGFDRIVLP